MEKSFTGTDLPSKFPTKYVQFPVGFIVSLSVVDELDMIIHSFKTTFLIFRSSLLLFIQIMLTVIGGLAILFCQRSIICYSHTMSLLTSHFKLGGSTCLLHIVFS